MMKTPESEERLESGGRAAAAATAARVPQKRTPDSQQQLQRQQQKKPKTANITGPLPKETPRTMIRAYTETGFILDSIFPFFFLIKHMFLLLFSSHTTLR
jgi:hypothetical protein